MLIGLILAAMLAAGPPPPVAGLDHMPVAVADLDGAARDFQRLGFVIKPGRLHDDGIRNRHVKFPNSGGIELITASSPTDETAREYADWLKGGEGPAFWAAYSPDLVRLKTALAAEGVTPTSHGGIVSLPEGFPHRLFFGDRMPSPTDGPQYWTHPNGAYRLKAVWLAGGSAERALLQRLGAKAGDAGCAPFDTGAARLVLAEGDEVIFSSKVVRSPEREIIGATVLVKTLGTARRVLDANGVRYLRATSCRARSLWIRPTDARGLWLELREE